MLPGAAAAPEAEGTELAADITFTGQTYEHQDVAEFMTRLGLIPQLTGITLATSTDSTTATGTSSASPAPTVTLKQFTVTAQLRPYTTQPPTTTLTEVAP
jgi:hypothetical protein